MPARGDGSDDGRTVTLRKNDRFAHDCQTSFPRDLSKPSNSEQAAASSWSSSVMVSRSPARMLSTPAASGVGTPPTSGKWINRPRLSGITASAQNAGPGSEGHQRADMAEWRAVKIKTDRRRRTGLGRGQPQEPRLVVNKAPDKRGAGRRSTHGRRQVAPTGREAPLSTGSVRPPPTAARSAIAAD